MDLFEEVAALRKENKTLRQENLKLKEDLKKEKTKNRKVAEIILHDYND